MKIDYGYISALYYKGNTGDVTDRIIDSNAPGQLVGQTIEGTLNGEEVKLTISDELNELVNRVNESYNQNSIEINDVFYQHLKVDENDPFSYKPNDQWLIFSQFLSEQNVFEGKSNEEVLEIEELLKK